MLYLHWLRVGRYEKLKKYQKGKKIKNHVIINNKNT